MPLTRVPIGLLACLIASAGQADVFVRDDIITAPTPSNFSVCYDHQCATLDTLSLQAQEWRSISRLFARQSSNPAIERKQIAQAIARLEQITGHYTGTEHDKGGDLKGLGQDGQMDCIDESINTTTYLKMLEDDDLMRWHTVEDRATRGWFMFGWPHTTAVIRDKRSGQLYAVDSWFLDNGKPPFIVPLEKWKDGWDPEDGK